MRKSKFTDEQIAFALTQAIRRASDALREIAQVRGSERLWLSAKLLA